MMDKSNSERQDDSNRVDEAMLRMELEGMKPSALQKWAGNAGVPQADLDKAVDDDNPKGALITLCVQAALRAELQPLKQSALQKRALAAGVSSDEIDNAVDDDDPKGALIDLILGRKRSEPPGSTLRREIHSNPDPVKLSMSKQSTLQLESLRAGDLARRKLSEDADDSFDYPLDPDSPITIVKTSSERSRGTQGSRHGFQTAASRRTSADSMNAASRRSSAERKPASRRGSFDRTDGKISRRGSLDRMSSYTGKATSRRGSFASTVYDEDDESRYFPGGLPPGGLPPPLGAMGGMPPMGMPPMGPPGFMNNNPWAQAMAAAAAMGSPPGMPPMMPPGYAGPWGYPPNMPSMGFPPNLGMPSGYPGSDNNVDRRGSNPDTFSHVQDSFQHARAAHFQHSKSDSFQHSGSVKSSRGGNTSRRSSEDRSSAGGQSQRQNKQKPVEKAPAEPAAKPTTLVLRDLPENYSRNKLQDLLDKYGFKGQYDFIYMPMNFRTKASFGYAFVNFVGNIEAQRCHDQFQGFTNWDVPSQKVCDVSWSNMHQGLAVHVDRYRNSPVMHESVEDEYKPALFEPGSGARATFPAPTKKLRVPRIRRPGVDGEGDGEGDEGETGDGM